MFSKPLNFSLESLARAAHVYQDFVWLDSADDKSASIMAFQSSETKVIRSQEDYSSFFNSITVSTQPHSQLMSGIWIGYLAYEAYIFNPLIPIEPSNFPAYPLALFRYYESYIYTLKGKSSFISFSPNAEKLYTDIEQLCGKVEQEKMSRNRPFKTIESQTSKSDYERNFNRIKESLRNGDYFELNYTIAFQTEMPESTLSLYFDLRKSTQAPMMFYGKFPEMTILSASPERFFRIEKDTISAFPIKGTIRRGADRNEDEINKTTLINSKKDQAELLMITDLLRSDLGRVCEEGSVTVDKLNLIHSFSHYHHLISEIHGKLKEETSLFTVLNALFPGGSITGAPKIKVIEEIDCLEGSPRGVYTGAIGYFTKNGFADFSIPIRTMVASDNHLSFSAGGGIVADSKCDLEYEECLLKASGIRQALGEKI